MNKIKEEMDKNTLCIEKLEKFMALSLKRDEIAEDVLAVANQIERVREQMQVVNIRLKNELAEMEAEYVELMRRMRRQQVPIIEHLIKQKQQQMQEEQNAIAEQYDRYYGSAVKPLSQSYLLPPGSAVKNLSASMTKMKLNNVQHSQTQGYVTPRTSVRDYKESSSIKRSRLQPLQLTFDDFEVENISAQVFETIPRYMRAGREGVEELNHFLQTVIVPCFNEKYLLLHRRRNALRGRVDMDLWQLYHSQSSYLPGKYFITPGDISRKMDKMLDRRAQNRITMLRHVGILQEQRVSGTVCYVWCPKMK